MATTFKYVSGIQRLSELETDRCFWNLEWNGFQFHQATVRILSQHVYVIEKYKLSALLAHGAFQSPVFDTASYFLSCIPFLSSPLSPPHPLRPILSQPIPAPTQLMSLMKGVCRGKAVVVLIMGITGLRGQWSHQIDHTIGI